MFDRYELGPSHVEVNTRITEQRAPTDESVRLLKEMEGAAREKLLESVRVQNCGIDAVLHRYEDCLTQQTRFLIIYKINGEQRRVEHSEYSMDLTIQKIGDALWKALADDIAGVLLRAMTSTTKGRGE